MCVCLYLYVCVGVCLCVGARVCVGLGACVCRCVCPLLELISFSNFSATTILF